MNDNIRIYNKRIDRIPANAVYIGRGSMWGNPFIIGRDGDRDEVIRKYKAYLFDSGLIGNVHVLAGRSLVCFCAPLRCHGDVLAHYANLEQPF